MSSPSTTRGLPRPGTVYLVGAGPGDPDLMTVRGMRCLRHAGTVLYDRLLDPALLAEAPAAAERIFVGKAPGRPGVGQRGIHQLLIEHAREQRVVVRLKGGDPFVFGRGGEEALALGAAGVPWEVVPGLSSAVAVPARAGIPVTHRGIARNFAVVTAHQVGEGSLDWGALARLDTLVVLMGVAALAQISRQLVAHGRDPRTPTALIERGTLPGERVITTDLENLARRARDEGVRSPAILVVGEVVALRYPLASGRPTPRRADPVPLAEVLPWPGPRHPVVETHPSLESPTDTTEYDKNLIEGAR